MSDASLRLIDGDPLAGGKARLIVEPAPTSLPDPVLVTISRGTQRLPFLGPKGWQATEHGFVAQRETSGDNRLSLLLGSAVVDNPALRDYDILEIALRDTGLSGRVVWEGITRSVAISPVSEPPAPPEPSPPPPPHPTPPPSKPIEVIDARMEGDDLAIVLSNVVEATSGETPVLVSQETENGRQFLSESSGWTHDGTSPMLMASVSATDTGVTLTLTPQANAHLRPGQTIRLEFPQWHRHTTVEIGIREGAAPPPPPPPSPKDRRWLLWASLVGLGLAILIAIVWWFFFWEDEAVVSPPQPPSPPPAQQFMEGEEAYNRGVEAFQAENCDLARQELQASIGADYGPAYLFWAEHQDSADFSSCLTETSNDVDALDNYEKACLANADGAKAAFDTFVSHLEAERDRNSPTAGTLLRLKVPKVREACGG
ncbi:MAG: hypothetical protein VYD57_04435 [Pseudomonadota bacterium]|nr:hypothetical protein [Pseudomonadota bacterium]